jgi:predicted RNase H-like nuclease (RuvC/YqgF family)
MTLFEYIVSIVFRIINFGLICAAFWYVIVKYIVPPATQDLKRQESEKNTIHITTESLTRQGKDLSAKLETENQKVSQLKNAIDQWSTYVTREQDLENKKLAQADLKYLHEQARLQQAAQDNKEYIHNLEQAIELARTELIKHFKDASVAYHYLDTIIKSTVEKTEENS